MWTNEVLKNWSSFFVDCDDLEDLAKHLSSMLLRYGCEKFLEGFGYVYTENDNGVQFSQYEYNEKGELVKVSEFAKGIKVKVVSMDDDYDYEINEIQ